VPKSIVIEGLQKRYKDIHAVRGVSFDVEQGEIFGIVGPNGAGKTTTIEIMEGLRKRDSGVVQILGLDPDQDPLELRQRIGVQFQTTSIQERMKVKEAYRCLRPSTANVGTWTKSSRVWDWTGCSTSSSKTCLAGGSSG
jgi:ABC-2 type transport system ATP-binding protein